MRFSQIGFPFYPLFNELYASVKEKNIIFTPESGPATIRYAISSSQRIWKVCWHINQVMGLSLGISSAVLGHEAPNEYFYSGDEEVLPGEHARKNIEDLTYSFVDQWVIYKLTTVRMAGMRPLPGFQFLLEVESNYSDGLPDATDILKKLKAVSIFSAIIILK